MWECAADVSASSAVRRTRRSALLTAAMMEGRDEATALLQWEDSRARLQAAAAHSAWEPEAEEADAS